MMNKSKRIKSEILKVEMIKMLRVMIPTVRLDRSREKLVMTWEEDSCLYEISLTGVARALKSFLEKMYQTTLTLVFRKVT